MRISLKIKTNYSGISRQQVFLKVELKEKMEHVHRHLEKVRTWTKGENYEARLSNGDMCCNSNLIVIKGE